MKIAVHLHAYNASRFIKLVLHNMAPFVDKIYVAYSHRPAGYVPESRANKSNPTAIDEILTAGIGAKLEVVQGDWLTEESMRNACLDRAKADGFDWMLIQDADEFYPEQSWHQILRVLRSNPQQEHFVTTWYNFWKSSHYVLANEHGEIKSTNAGFAIRCRQHLKFTDKRLTNAVNSRVIDAPCYHYGYVVSNEEMAHKISTWGHAREFNTERWYRLKWMNWRETTRYLHPTSPATWKSAIRFPLEQPDFADEFALPVKPAVGLTLNDLLSDSA
jgi:hypothetical protein